MQNGNKEPDNLGQVLYLQSLVKNKNTKLISEIIEEASSARNSNGYIEGLTDGFNHPVYQTKWLIFGLKSLGLDYSEYIVPDVYDNYNELTWFYNEPNKGEPKGEISLSDYPYLDYAYVHFYNMDVEIGNKDYPISYEKNASKAVYSNLEIIGESYEENKLIVPHSWTASEMFLYLIEKE